MILFYQFSSKLIHLDFTKYHEYQTDVPAVMNSRNQCNSEPPSVCS